MVGRPLVLAVDLDDTLYLERDYVNSGLASLSKWLASAHGIHGFYSASALLFEQGVRHTIFNQALDQLGYSYDPALITAMVAHYRSHSPTISLPHDARWFLQWVRSRCYTALITDGYSVAQRRKIDALGLHNTFDHIVVCDELGRECWKPSRVPFDDVIRCARTHSSRAIYIGDNPGKDVLGPANAGWSAILLRRKGGEHEREPIGCLRPTAVVESLHEAVSVVVDIWSRRGAAPRG